MYYNSPLALPSRDLQRCFDIVGTFRWQRLLGQRLFITGGTGFVGKWLLGTLIFANEVLDLDCNITVLSRNPEAFLTDWPLIDGRITWLSGDVCTLDISSKPYDVIIHAATDVVRKIPCEELFFSIVEGTRRVVDMALNCKTCRLLLMSSGAVYGELPEDILKVSETYCRVPNPVQRESAYGEGKRVAEQLVVDAAASRGIICRIARLFSTLGPHIPLDQHFAIGNFIRDALENRAITINGDGSPLRSYLYAADMAAWLWSILLEETTPSAVYNVGSDHGISILDLAKLVGKTVGSNQHVEFKNSLQVSALKPIPSLGCNHYVPDCSSVLRDFDLPQPLGLTEAIRRTAEWYRLGAHSNI